MSYAIQFIVTLTASTVVAVAVGNTVVDIVDQKLQPVIEALSKGGELPAQSSEHLQQPKPAPEDYI